MRRLVPSLAICGALAASQPAFVASFSGNPYEFSVNAVKVDSAGNTYITGYTRGGPLPVTADAMQPQPPVGSGGTGQLVCTGPPLSGVPVGPCVNAFILKLDPSGALVYGSYLGGPATALGSDIAIDSAGNVYVCGFTQPPGFPVTPGAAFPTANVNVVSAFVQKYDSTLQNLIYSTYLPGITIRVAIGVDAAGNAYVGGTTMPACLPASGCGTPYNGLFPATSGAFQTSPKNNASAGVVAALNASGSALIYATYLSGSVVSGIQQPDAIRAIDVDSAGNVFVTGNTGAPDFPVTSGAFQTTLPNSASAAFVAELNPRGSALLYSTYLGGNGQDFGFAIKADSHGEAWVLGQTGSTNFPVNAAAFDSTPQDLFLAHVSADGAALRYSTYFPGILGAGEALDVDAAGDAYVASSVATPALPTSASAIQPSFGGDTDAYIAEFAPGGRFLGATYLGGESVTYGDLIALGPDGSAVIAGATQSPDFPGLAQPITGGRVAYVARLVPWPEQPHRAR